MWKIFLTATLYFLLLISLAMAYKVEVLYFYSSTCPISSALEPVKVEVKNFWKKSIKWSEYDFMKNKKPFEEYMIFNFPVSIVECFNRSYRIERDEIATKLNATIAKCFECDGVEILEKECEAGDIETKVCGKCGVSYRYCESNCQFGSWSKCINERECYPGSSEKKSCNVINCAGYQTRNCKEDCYWGEWSPCIKLDPECKEVIKIIPQAKKYIDFKVARGYFSLFLIFSSLIVALIFLRKI